MPKKPVDPVALIKQGVKRPEMVVPICLRGDLVSEIYKLDAELKDIGEQSSVPMLNGDPKARAIAKKIEALRVDAKEHTVNITLRAMPKKEWADLVAKHPAADKSQDFAMSIFNDAVPACIVDPELDPETLSGFLDGLTQGQWDELAGAAYTLNAGDGAVPFSALASRALRTYDESLKPPEPTG